MLLSDAGSSILLSEVKPLYAPALIETVPGAR